MEQPRVSGPADVPPLLEEEQELAERFRVELRFFARQQRGMEPAEADRALEHTTEHLVRLAREYALHLVRVTHHNQ